MQHVDAYIEQSPLPRRVLWASSLKIHSTATAKTVARLYLFHNNTDAMTHRPGRDVRLARQGHEVGRGQRTGAGPLPRYFA